MDWKSTLNLPKTEFPMRADLARREPEWLARWAKERQYENVLEARLRDEAPEYVLHDGPPYATGAIHYGTVLNKVLKDIVVRSQTMMGKRAVFRPGWDCHGLPIEHQVEKNLSKDERGLDPVAFRQRCEEHALKFVDVMRTEFKRLGCVGNWDDPYLTLAKDYEATIARQLAGFVEAGLVYRDKKPIHWCFVHRTALAEAEVEYEDHNSPSIYVRFPIAGDLGKADPRLRDQRAAFVIWTTTPWTLPANLAVVANPELDYVAIPRDGEYLIVAAGRADQFMQETGVAAPQESWIPLSRVGLRALEGTTYTPPFPRPSADAKRDYRLWFARHATLEAGTGLVHTAPGHGAEDYIVGREHGLEIFAPVDEQGKFAGAIDRPQWMGKRVLDANPEIVTDLAARGLLLNKPGETVRHSYPHCWRCHNPIIFRATEQWFARLGDATDEKSLRHRSLAEIARTQWIPAWGKDRIGKMIEARPDWCLSRQRVWGVPIPAFRCTKCGKDLLDAKVIEHVADIFAREGSNAWFSRPAAELLPAGNPHWPACTCGGREFDKQHDIVDVWFESGVSWAAVAEGKLLPAREKVDLYLEGADQHRGWFHSSLLTAVATRGQAPYKAVLTHGWVLDERGKPYSKSDIAKARAAGAKVTYVDPAVWMEKNGAELLRLWTAASDYQGDVVFSDTILGQLGESYRKIRNTCRYLLSNLYDFVPSRDRLEDHELRELDLLALGVLRERDHQIFDCYKRYSFHEVVRLMNDHAITVSAEYLDPIKDALYCEAPDSRARRSVQTAVYEMIRTVSLWMAPILCFTAQDVADELARATGEPFDVHGAVRVVDLGEKLGNPNKRWTGEIRPRREAILQKLEAFRAAGHKSLEARVRVTPAAAERPHWQWSLAHLAELCVVSRVELDAADAAETLITVDEAPGPTCPRCWRRTGEAAGAGAPDPDLCLRCAAVVHGMKEIPPS